MRHLASLFPSCRPPSPPQVQPADGPSPSVITRVISSPVSTCHHLLALSIPRHPCEYFRSICIRAISFGSLTECVTLLPCFPFACFLFSSLPSANSAITSTGRSSIAIRHYLRHPLAVIYLPSYSSLYLLGFPLNLRARPDLCFASTKPRYPAGRPSTPHNSDAPLACHRANNDPRDPKLNVQIFFLLPVSSHRISRSLIQPVAPKA
jgi:hypothetical protein